ncbi:unnamed protein product [Rotaria magnacalcarata]|uniref:Uncharacterized protein n=1 Tax=Rotaria magnacalcarata TaxID=392030 RepID=A0A816YVM0_9BILA|nr:unnamed protein product [Rotaria magnacalcarata]CAF1613477.1 unnamed protein product [Rotaria magnacalcarata]CAF1981353.1 unnamed protein product [Rotaria magnacalcarata]CAF2139269.1 unnamed protein product [Rotaria magnacalcarata]CAF2170557.1 unnamed protein product [Rotaria magnacalcarata]
MSFHQRDEIRWNKKGYFERFDGKKYWRKLCVIEGCMKRAKVLNWCKRHYTEHKHKSSITTTSTQGPQQSLVSSIPSSLTTSTHSNSMLSSNILFHQPHYHNLQAVSQIPMPPPAYLYTSVSSLADQSQSIFHTRNEIRLNKRGFREQYDGIGHWRPLCIHEQCTKRAKKLSYCKRHYTEHVNQNQSISTSIKAETDNND